MATILDLPEMHARVRRWTVGEYAELEDNPAFRHSELIRGFIIEKMPKTPLYDFLPDQVCEFFRRNVRAGLCVRQEASLRLADSVPEPEAAMVAGKPGDFRTRHPTTALLVVEVAVSSVALDRENASLYAEAGVMEYWIVLAEAEQIEVYRRSENGVYQEKRTYARGEVIEGVSVTVEPVAVETFFQ